MIKELNNKENGNDNRTIKVKCPVCHNKRLFDVINACRAEIEIKCYKCGSKIHISLENNKINVIEV